MDHSGIFAAADAKPEKLLGFLSSFFDKMSPSQRPRKKKWTLSITSLHTLL